MQHCHSRQKHTNGVRRIVIKNRSPNNLASMFHHFRFFGVSVAREGFLCCPHRDVYERANSHGRDQLKHSPVAIVQFALAVAAHRGGVYLLHGNMRDRVAPHHLREEAVVAISAVGVADFLSRLGAHVLRANLDDFPIDTDAPAKLCAKIDGEHPHRCTFLYGGRPKLLEQTAFQPSQTRGARTHVRLCS
jgi:hypothetical protein